jgi:hypothetical protein
VTDGKNGRILYDRPKPTVGCSASGRRKRSPGGTDFPSSSGGIGKRDGPDITRESKALHTF